MVPVGLPYDLQNEIVQESRVARILREAGFSVTRDVSAGGKSLDLEARILQFGLTRIYGIEIKHGSKPVGVAAVRDMMVAINIGSDVHEFWIIANSFTKEARRAAKGYRSLRLFTFDEFEHSVGISLPSDRPLANPKTAIGKQIVENRPQIVLLSASLLILIDERIEALGRELPNSDEAKAARDEAIAQYAKLKHDLQLMNASVIGFSQGKVKESAAVSSSKSFADGLIDWWTKSHQQICERAYDMSMFGMAVGICSMAGAGGKVAVGVSAALVGGKKLGDALKGLKGLWH